MADALSKRIAALEATTRAASGTEAEKLHLERFQSWLGRLRDDELRAIVDGAERGWSESEEAAWLARVEAVHGPMPRRKEQACLSPFRAACAI